MLVHLAALLLTSTLFGGMVVFSFGFAPVLFAQLPADRVRPLLRGTFPHYYLAVTTLSAAAALAALPVSGLAAGLLAAIAVTTIYARQDLMHRINAASDRADRAAFGRLHGASVALQLGQIGLAGWAVALIASV